MIARRRSKKAKRKKKMRTGVLTDLRWKKEGKEEALRNEKNVKT